MWMWIFTHFISYGINEQVILRENNRKRRKEGAPLLGGDLESLF